jgi:hypothetical protein
VEGGKVSVQEPTAFARASSAVLVLPSGERIVLDGQTDREVDAEGETVARTSGQSISYTEANRLPSEPVYHELHIPRGGEFFLTLSDGSRVWLNADTKVRYPLYFAGGERKIYVEGEVYLEVAHREASPFRVVTPACDVTVLGTHFNVSAYPDAFVPGHAGGGTCAGDSRCGRGAGGAGARRTGGGGGWLRAGGHTAGGSGPLLRVA